jgi:5'-3' exonuclease
MIAIIDGDILCYSACKDRWKTKYDTPPPIQLDSNGKKIPLEFTKVDDTLYMKTVWKNFKKELQELLDELFCDEFMMAVKGGEDNYRNAIYPEYKANRNPQNEFVPAIRKLAVREGLAIEASGREADDLVRIWAEECRKINKDFIICSIDKDLLCIPGKHYLMHKKTFKEVSEDEGIRHFYEQLLKGDSTDNIPGIPGIGNVKAAKLLKDFNTEEEFQRVIVEQYFLYYGEACWLDMLLVNGKMLYIQKEPYDFFSCLHWSSVEEMVI